MLRILEDTKETSKENFQRVKATAFPKYSSLKEDKTKYEYEFDLL